jgi:CelD/BcsL family acetyltransferase involved in cellulose biosynthesis
MAQETARTLDTPSRMGIPNVTVELKVCQTWAELEVLRPEWDGILRNAVGSTVFSSLDWLSAWWKSYGSGRELVALLFFSADGELVGLAPLYCDARIVLGRRLKVLRLAGDGSKDSENLDFVVRFGYEDACALRFLSWFRQRRAWDLCVLDTLPDASLFAKALLRYLRSSKWSILERRSTHLLVHLPDSWEGYLQRLSPEFRPLLTRYPRRLKATHKVDIYQCSKTADLRKNLSTLFSLHQKRWQKRGKNGAFGDPNRCRFYYEVARSFLEKGWLEFWLMDVDGATVAAQFCVRFAGTVYLLQEGFDPQYMHEKVGYALRAEMFQDLIRRGIQQYDFLAGRDPYKLRFGAEESSYLAIGFATPVSLGSTCLALKRFDLQARRWAHGNLPEPVIRLLRSVFSTSNSRWAWPA